MESSKKALAKRIARWVLAGAMVFIGIGHFVAPEPFVRIVPDWLPAPLWLVWISGFFEVLGGLGLLVERTRKWAGIGLIALYLAVFPANIYMATEGIQLDPDNPMPEWIAWARLPFQLLFIAWAWWVSRPAD